MKLSNAYDGLQNENRYLRTIGKLLIMVTGLSLGLCLIMYDKNPIIVERSSHGLEIVRPTEFTPTEQDISQAVNLMLKARFDTANLAPEVFLNSKQLALRDLEQKDLKARGISQNILVKKVSVNKDEILADIDRVLAIGEVRSALKAQVKVRFEVTTPNEINPYGLLLSLSDPTQTKEASK